MMTDSVLSSELVDLARRVVEENRRAGRTFALAESCTGGLVSAAITEIPGSSEVFEASFVTYSNELKQELLKVSQDVLETFGSVSIATAWGMAQGALKLTHAHVAVAITGIAGPGGGTEQKPVGTVVFARAERGGSPDNIAADLKKFEDNGRSDIRLQVALCALELLLPESEGP